MTDKRPEFPHILQRLLEALDAHLADRVLLMNERPRQGLLFGALESRGLDALDVALALSALRTQLAGDLSISGTDLALAVADHSCGRLEALARLGPEARLLRGGVLIPEVAPEHPADARGTSFRLSDELFRQACEIFGQPTPPATDLPDGPFRSNAEALGELRRLSLHYRRRAARIFHLDPWTGTGIEVLDNAAILVERARQESQRISKRLAATSPDAGFAALQLQREFALDENALVILATVLFQELLEGVGAVDAVDLVKLVSESEEQLLENREILRPLARAGLLRLEGAYANKDLTADASLPTEVIAALLGDAQAIDSDHRLDFHAYLQQLDSSDPFFDDMDGSSFGS
jgi:hypothetical protein